MNTTLFIFILFLLALPANAKSFSIKKNKNGQVILQGERCQDFTEQINALSDWKHKLGEKIIKETEKRCECKTFLGCSMVIDTFVPKLVQQVLGKKPKYDGPNCWNSVLVSNKILSHLRETSDAEMSFWLNSPLCRELRTDEKAMPGDIIAARYGFGDEMHAFIYITDKLAFNKNALVRSTPYEFKSVYDILYDFGVRSQYNDRPHCGRTSSKNEQRCPRFAVYYRCMTLDNYLSNITDANFPSSELEKAFAEIYKIESFLSNGIWGISEMPQLDWKDMLKSLIVDAKEALENDTLSKDEHLFWKSIIVRSEAISLQLKTLKI